MSDHGTIDAEIALTVVFLRAHPEADLEAVLRRFAAFVVAAKEETTGGDDPHERQTR